MRQTELLNWMRVESATVIVTNHNAYAAVVLKGNATTTTTTNTNTNTNTNPDQVLSPDLENKIAEKVREANTNIKNVYVSLNPEFVEHMTGYGERINRGEPVAGFFDEFTETMRRVFPNAH